MTHISNMNTNLIITIFQYSEWKGIIKILCINRVNSKCQNITEIFSFSDLLCR